MIDERLRLPNPPLDLRQISTDQFDVDNSAVPTDQPDDQSGTAPTNESVRRIVSLSKFMSSDITAFLYSFRFQLVVANLEFTCPIEGFVSLISQSDRVLNERRALYTSRGHRSFFNDTEHSFIGQDNAYDIAFRVRGVLGASSSS